MKRNFEKLMAEGDRRLDLHPRYDLLCSECLEGCSLFFRDGKLQPISGNEILKTIDMYFSAGIAAGYRMAVADQKRKRQKDKTRVKDKGQNIKN